MFKICMCSCLLLAMMMVEMKALKVTGHVGGKVTFNCSNWKSWMDVETTNKYLCVSPCNKDKHVIVKAAFSNTEREDRIQIRNIADGLFVTFMDLKLSDSKKYYCGVERFGLDSFIEVDLHVIDDPKTSIKTTTVGSPVSFAVTAMSTVSSRLDLLADSSESYSIIYTSTTAAAANKTGSVPYLIAGFIVSIVSLIVLLLLMRTVRRRYVIVRSFPPDSPQDNQHVEFDYGNIRREDQQTGSRTAPATPAHRSTANPDTDSESLYTNYSFLQRIKLETEWNNYSEEDSFLVSMYEVDPAVACAGSRGTDPSDDMVYSLAQLPKEKTEDSGQSDSAQPKSNEEDFKHPLPQLP